jgi:hypothetical protein
MLLNAMLNSFIRKVILSLHKISLAQTNGTG